MKEWDRQPVFLPRTSGLRHFNRRFFANFDCMFTAEYEDMQDICIYIYVYVYIYMYIH